jgi:hypothetical protein
VVEEGSTVVLPRLGSPCAETPTAGEPGGEQLKLVWTPKATNVEAPNASARSVALPWFRRPSVSSGSPFRNPLGSHHPAAGGAESFDGPVGGAGDAESDTRHRNDATGGGGSLWRQRFCMGTAGVSRQRRSGALLVGLARASAGVGSESGWGGRGLEGRQDQAERELVVGLAAGWNGRSGGWVVRAHFLVLSSLQPVVASVSNVFREPAIFAWAA